MLADANGGSGSEPSRSGGSRTQGAKTARWHIVCLPTPPMQAFTTPLGDSRKRMHGIAPNMCFGSPRACRLRTAHMGRLQTVVAAPRLLGQRAGARGATPPPPPHAGAGSPRKPSLWRPPSPAAHGPPPAGLQMAHSTGNGWQSAAGWLCLQPPARPKQASRASSRSAAEQ